MNMTAVMAEIATVLAELTGPVRVYAGYVAKVTPPATGAVVVVPYADKITYNQTYKRGMTTIDQPVLIVLGRPTDRATADRMVAYTDDAGGGSVRAVLEDHTWTTCDTVRVDEVTFDVVTISGVDYLAGEWIMQVVGSGRT